MTADKKPKPCAIPLGKGGKGFMEQANHRAQKPLPAITPARCAPPMGRELKVTEERIKCALSTHPDIATLVTPLSALRIEGIFISFFLNPLCGEAGEWVIQRSVDRVSRLCIMIFLNKACSV